MPTTKEDLETLMRGSKNFTIHLTDFKQQTFLGAVAQDSSKKNSYKIIPNFDKLTFQKEKDGEKVIYTRVYWRLPALPRLFSTSW